MIELRNISKTYVNSKKVEKVALRNISEKFQKGEFVSVLGPSGCGKTTLLNIIGGLDNFDKGGEMVISGYSTKKFKQKHWDAYRSAKVGFVFQYYELMEDLNVYESVYMGLSFMRLRPREIKRLTEQALKRVGIWDLRKVQVENLAGGERQRVAIARAIAKNPEVLLCDEPTGALDKKTGKEIMDLLKEISRNCIVVMATHNEELAEEYSTRIINLEDGEIVGGHVIMPPLTAAVDDKIKNAEEDGAAKDGKSLGEKMVKKTSSLSFLTSIFLGLKSIWKKKFRYLLVILAGGFGVIGIAVILSISTGLNSYIQNAQDTIYAQYPIVFNQTRDLSELDSYVEQQQELEKQRKLRSEELEENKTEAQKNHKIALRNQIGALLSTNGESTTQNKSKVNNDIASLKKFLDTNPGNINDDVSDLEYVYRSTPIIYAQNSNGIKEVYPKSGLFGSIGTNSGQYSSGGYETTRVTSSSAFSAKKLITNFGSLPKDQSIYRDDDCLVAGHWPETPYECLLVLNSDSTIDDTLLYSLGMRNFREDLEPLIEKYLKGEKVEWPGQTDTYDYDEFIGKKLKMINPSECYKYSSEKGHWVDMSHDDEYMTNVVSNGKDLVIVGVVLPTSDSVTGTILNKGVQFPYQLNEITIKETQNEQIVKDQLANPETDVLTGETFEYLRNASNVFSRFDFSHLVEFNLDMLVDSIKIHPEALELNIKSEEKAPLTPQEEIEILVKLIKSKDFQELIKDITAEGEFDEGVYQVLSNAAAKYLEYTKECEEQGEIPLEAEEWFQSPNEGYLYVKAACLKLPIDMIQDAVKFVQKWGPKLVDALLNVFQQQIEKIAEALITAVMDENRPQFIEFDAEKFGNALKLNITLDDIKQMAYALTGATNHTYYGNLADFGYADMNDPVALTIYPKDYQSKQNILSIIESYNDNARKTNEDKVVTYTDYASTGIEIATKAVSAISLFLVLIISISLISSTLLIGVIFGVTSMQRRKDVGIMRALGARKKDVARAFNCESGLVGMIIGFFGIGAALLINWAINSSMNLEVDIAQLPASTALILILVSIVLTILAGVIPVTIASRKDPVKTLRGM